MTWEAMSVATKRGRGRPALISREKIARAALEIGLQNITIKGVGQHLGVDHSSLYGHIKNREDLILAAVDIAIEDMAWPDGATEWRQYLHGLAQMLWDTFHKTPGLAGLFQSPSFAPETGVIGYCNAVAGLAAFGFEEDDAMVIIDSIFDMTADTVAMLDQIPLIDADTKDWNAVFEVMDNATTADAQMARILTRTKQRIETDPKEWWDRKLDILLEGARSYAPDSTPAGTQ